MILREKFLKAGIRLALCTLAILVSASSFKSADTIPSEISDQAYWKMIVGMSEPDGQFRFENFLSNELQYQYVIPGLKSGTRSGGVYLGVGPEQNFTYIAAIRPKIAFITDIRRQNMLELMMYRAIFELSGDRADFLSMLFSASPPRRSERQFIPGAAVPSLRGLASRSRAIPVEFESHSGPSGSETSIRLASLGPAEYCLCVPGLFYGRTLLGLLIGRAGNQSQPRHAELFGIDDRR
jgi:hypothetical protein